MNTLSKHLNNILLDSIDNAGLVKPYFNYSGRGMYGRTCFGVVVPRSTSSFDVAMSIIADMINTDQNQSDINEIMEALSEAREDSLGLDTILYFPNLQIDRIQSDIEDEEE